MMICQPSKDSNQKLHRAGCVSLIDSFETSPPVRSLVQQTKMNAQVEHYPTTVHALSSQLCFSPLQDSQVETRDHPAQEVQNSNRRHCEATQSSYCIRFVSLGVKFVNLVSRFLSFPNPPGLFLYISHETLGQGVVSRNPPIASNFKTGHESDGCRRLLLLMKDFSTSDGSPAIAPRPGDWMASPATSINQD
ncbi:uncharacterized protein BJX67DRAFT_130377 [Aspergillus lucknowensis]|uniref:Uncharacterized protein n=1 Tax=Aspergillus lucknowensis TaxID=176173 RepID=A0ABR4LPT4_9EURO